MTTETFDKSLAQISRYGELIIAASLRWHDFNCSVSDQKPPTYLDYYFRPSSGYLSAIHDFIATLPQNDTGVCLFKALRKSVAKLFHKLGDMGYGIFGQEIIAHFFFEKNADFLSKAINTHVSKENLCATAVKYQEELVRRFNLIASQLKDILKCNRRYHEFTRNERNWQNPFFARIYKDTETHAPIPLTPHYQESVKSIDMNAGTITLVSGKSLLLSPRSTKVWATLRILLGYSDTHGYAQLPHGWEKAFEHRSGHFTSSAQCLFRVRKMISPKSNATKSNNGWYKITLRG